MYAEGVGPCGFHFLIFCCTLNARDQGVVVSICRRLWGELGKGKTERGMGSRASGKQYGLQLRVKGPPKSAVRPVAAFSFDDGNDEGTVEDDIARQASKKRTVREVAQQHKKALEEDPTAFDYDGVYDEMKGNQARPIQEDRARREPKYIGKLLEKAKERAREHDIVYERQLAKERQKEDHLFGDKEKFVTGAYKKKLQEQAKWLEEERHKELREQQNEVTNKSDMSDFYRNLLKNNVAFGAKFATKPSETASKQGIEEAERPEAPLSDMENEPVLSTTASQDGGSKDPGVPRSNQNHDRAEPTGRGDDSLQGQSSSHLPGHQPRDAANMDRSDPVSSSRSKPENESSESPLPRQEEHVHVEALSSEAKVEQPVDPVAAAKERYMARKRQRDL